MKQQKCKRGKLGFCYDYGNCEGCEISDMIIRYEGKIKRLKAKNETLNREINIWKDGKRG